MHFFESTTALSLTWRRAVQCRGDSRKTYDVSSAWGIVGWLLSTTGVLLPAQKAKESGSTGPMACCVHVHVLVKVLPVPLTEMQHRLPKPCKDSWLLQVMPGRNCFSFQANERTHEYKG